MEELVRQDSKKLAYAIDQIDRCTRLMLQLPVDASSGEIAEMLRDEGADYQASLVSGYQCLVLGIRRKLIGDSLYDDTMRGMAHALEEEIKSQLEHCSGVYTSDQSTQLHAI